MDKYIGCTVDSICRTCLNIINGRKFDLLLLPALAKKIVTYTTLTVQPDDIFPKNLCKDCYTKLNEFDEFHTMCVESVSRFQELFSMSILKERFFLERLHLGGGLPSVKVEVDLEMDIQPEEVIETTIAKEDQPPPNQQSENHKSVKTTIKIEDDPETNILSEEILLQLKRELSDSHSSSSSSESEEESEEEECGDTQISWNKEALEGGSSTEGQSLLDGAATMARCPDPNCGLRLNQTPTLSWLIKNHSAQINAAQCDCHKRYIKQQCRQENSTKKYPCPHCETRTNSASELKKHINIHTREKKYPCPSCDKVFYSKRSVTSHRRFIHERLKPYKCSFCDRKFCKSLDCKHHEMIHTGEKPHECPDPDCKKSFILLMSMKRHYWKVHAKSDLFKTGGNVEEQMQYV